jgi:non-ribosomal peptide synthetase component E (peptide arylation enzyme)
MSFNLAVMLRESSRSFPDKGARSWVKARTAAYKYPGEIHLVDALPNGPVGKIGKQTLRVAMRAAAEAASSPPTQETHGRTS